MGSLRGRRDVVVRDSRGKKSIKAYYEVPAVVIERARELKAWAREAISAAQG